jgi:hypothetical protein
MTYMLTLTIAGVNFAVTAPSAAWRDGLAERYAPFLMPAPPGWQLHLTHEAPIGAARAWVVHEEAATRFSVGQMAGVIDMGARVAEVSAPDLGYAGSAVDRALSYILMQELPRKHDALLLHGVAIVRHGWGLAHSGRSGVGKTTTARLAARFADVLVDENLVVSLASPQPALLSTPFWGGSTPPELIHRVNRQAPLRALLLLEHGPDFVLEPLSRGDAVLALLTTEKVAVERVSSASAWLATAGNLVDRVPTYRLHFRPTQELWPFLDDALGLDAMRNDER